MRRVCLVVVVLLGLVTPGWTATLTWIEEASPTALIAPNSIANNVFTAQSSAVTPNGYLRCRFEAILNYAVSPSANAAVYIWIQESLDGGVTYATAPTASINPGAPQLAIPIVSGTTGVTSQMVTIPCPPTHFKITAQLNSPGQTTAGSGNSIRVRRYTLVSQ